ncbi:MAG: pyridoxal phosphate-dependent aminotransferase, partial [Calditrichia bacterium]|nr:pyridoxal phosphate-dependent aminotransferase [Calditrichia bacterium]
TSNNIMIANGAVNALNAAVFSIVNPGEEIIVLTPCWPFFMGIVNIAEGKIKEAPFYPGLYDNPDFDVEDYLQKHISEKTVAIYLNTPNNPSGKVLTLEQIKSVAKVVKKNKLWLISDEAYESFTYDGLIHYSIANYEDIFEQTITIFSFAKMFMIAGYRLGYVVGTPSLLEMMNKILVHQIYSTSSLIQYIMIEPVKTRDQWLPELKQRYEEFRNIAYDNLKVLSNKPESGYYLFFSLKPYLKNKTFNELFEEILNTGVALSPGERFGKDFAGYVRLCFTSVEEDKLVKGIELLNGVLEG